MSALKLAATALCSSAIAAALTAWATTSKRHYATDRRSPEEVRTKLVQVEY